MSSADNVQYRTVYSAVQDSVQYRTDSVQYRMDSVQYRMDSVQTWSIRNDTYVRIRDQYASKRNVLKCSHSTLSEI